MYRLTALAVAAVAQLGAMSPALAALEPTTLNSARIERRGPTFELHFGFDGTVPRLNLSAHDNQLWIELARTRVAIPPRPLFGQEVAPIVSVRAVGAGPDAAKSRIVVEVIGKADYAVARLPHEIVLRIATTGADPNIAAPIVVHNDASHRVRRTLALARSDPQPAPDRLEPASVRPLPQQASVEPVISSTASAPGHPLVMIDPGHGGYDPGTQSSSGVLEKDLALQIATRLKSALQSRGIRAELTRNTDEFISLSERTRIANNATADLFVSIHLNSSPNTDTTGIEVYYLNNTTDRATIRLARMENGGADGYGGSNDSNLNYILTDLRQNYKAAEAASVARMIDAQTVADLDAGLGLNVNALGAKMGPFYVLVGAHMPAVLVECGFLSNPGEARRLEGAGYQDVLAGAIAGAVVHYFNADLAVGNL